MTTTSIAFLAKDSFGVPVAGLTPTWLAYYNAVTGLAQGSPAINDRGSGNYSFTPTGNDPAGMLDLGGTGVPRYLAYSHSSTVLAFAAFDSTGFPLAGLTPTWASLVKVSDGSAYAQPAISALGNGLYKTDLIVEHVTGAIDLGATAFPRYYHYDSEPRAAAATPVVSNVSPVSGQSIYPDTPLQFDLTSVGGFAVIIPMISMDPFKVPEPTHNTEDFEPLYIAGSTRVAITNGYRYTLRRKGGWYATPRLVIWAVNDSGIIWTGP